MVLIKIIIFFKNLEEKFSLNTTRFHLLFLLEDLKKNRNMFNHNLVYLAIIFQIFMLYYRRNLHFKNNSNEINPFK
jgi:hypothetical protein